MAMFLRRPAMASKRHQIRKLDIGQLSDLGGDRASMV